MEALLEALPRWLPAWHFGWSPVALTAVVVVLLVNAYFVATEFALVAARRSQVRLWLKEGRRGAGSALRAIEQLDDSIAATQLGITLTSIGLGFLGEPAIARLIEPQLENMGAASFVTVHSTSLAISFALVTFLHVVVGELVPKAVALDRPADLALLFARPLLVFGSVFRPLLWMMNGTANGMLRLLGVQRTGDAHRIHSPDELSLLVSESQEAGAIRPDTGRIIGQVFRLSRVRVREVMVPRERMAAIERHMSPDDVLDRLREEGYTRLPVYDGTLDRIVGILHTKDLFHLYAKSRLIVLEDAIRPAVWFLPDVPVVDALRRFRRGRRHMGIVHQKDGRVIGLVTLEDVLEEVVGEIEDEHDQPTAAGSE
ncbi:MAG: HlyC/CorC family transporter [Deltaproteobacteria bacterium]|nr:HlyC/CorC family transporter [Deltaproteobacteria bacterium]